MRFTLRFEDYIEQYMLNKAADEPFCPVCYEKCMTFDKKTDAEHIIECYREDLIMRKLRDMIELTGGVPALDVSFINSITQQIEDELDSYQFKY